MAIARAIVARIGHGVTTSVVAGEPDNAADLGETVAAMAGTGADYVKVAVGSDWDASTLATAAAALPGRLIGVLFAEDGPTPSSVSFLSEAGFHGAMIDTRGKDGRRLTDHLTTEHLAVFTATCRRHGLLSGLAGSLRLEDVPVLAPLFPDYLGFRGGVCLGSDRRRALDPARIRAVAAALRGTGRRDAA